MGDLQDSEDPWRYRRCERVVVGPYRQGGRNRLDQRRLLDLWYEPVAGWSDFDTLKDGMRRTPFR